MVPDVELITVFASSRPQNRIPFMVPDRVPWSQMSEALSCKFMSEVQTTRALDRGNLHCLAQKIFDKPDISEDFSNTPVSWAQFNKVLFVFLWMGQGTCSHAHFSQFCLRPEGTSVV